MSQPTVGLPDDVEAAIDAIHSVAELFGGDPDCTVTTLLDRRTYSLDAVGERISEWLPTFEAACRANQRVTVLHSSGNLSVEWHTNHPTEIEGHIDDLDSVMASNLGHMVQSGDVAGLFELLRDHTFGVVVECSYSTRDTLWIPARHALEAKLCTGAWASCLQQLTAKSGNDHLTIVLDDQPANMDVIETPLFMITGYKRTDLPHRRPSTDRNQLDATELSRLRRINEGWTALPSPVNLVPASRNPGDSLAKQLNWAAFLAAWYWMSAEKPEVTTSSVSVHYKGVRDVRLDLAPRMTAIPDVEPVLDLWQWATATTDATRQAATQQAISYAVADAHDLDNAAGAVLRTAKSIHELAARDLISEALAARRSGRAAAAAAAATAVQAAQQASGKAIERSLAMLGAAAAVVFATVQDVLHWYASAIALVVLALIFIGGLRLSLVIDIASASKTIRSTKDDLDQYRDTLTSADLQAIKSMHVLSDAEAQVRRSCQAVWVIYVASAAVSLTFALLFALVRPG